MKVSRRDAVAALSLGALGSLLPAEEAKPPVNVSMRTFKADITPPIGHPLLAGLKPPAKSIKERLEARGIIFTGDMDPIAIIALDWCELRNEAYDYFREQVAKAILTQPERVLFTCIHQHDAPYFDLHAQELLDEVGLKGAMHDRDFFNKAVAAVCDAANKQKPVPLTGISYGKSKVERIACNRRVELQPGKPNFSRYSFTSDPAVRDAPEGAIDPELQTLGFYSDGKLAATLSVYAVHPMSYYGRGEVSYDFPGMARTMADREDPNVFHMYVSGCSGDVVAAKYNDGTEAGRLALAERLASAMSESIKNLKPMKHDSVAQYGFRKASLELPPPEEGALHPDRLKETIADKSRSTSDRITAALGLSYWERCQKKLKLAKVIHPTIDVPLINFGEAAFLVLPAEMFVEYQLAARELWPERRLLVAGFGECAPGYIPTEKTRREGFVEEHSYCWNKPGAEEAVMKAVKECVKGLH